MNSDSRRQKIIDAAVNVLAEKGVAGSRMNDFVEASGLSKGGVYHHFASKEDLMIGVLENFVDDIVTRIDMSMDSSRSAYAQLKDMLQNHQEVLLDRGQYNQLILDFFAQAPHLPRFHELMRQQYFMFHRQLADLIRLGVEQKEFAKDTDADAIAAGIRGIFDGMGIARMIVPEKIDFPRFAIEGALAMLEGLRR